ncbi:hypothetical protein Q3G72_034983 [Acer saccharum]|nr:hypothetical protein Q3G72_034983 [Acer saccharum]
MNKTIWTLIDGSVLCINNVLLQSYLNFVLDQSWWFTSIAKVNEKLQKLPEVLDQLFALACSRSEKRVASPPISGAGVSAVDGGDTANLAMDVPLVVESDKGGVRFRANVEFDERTLFWEQESLRLF